MCEQNQETEPISDTDTDIQELRQRVEQLELSQDLNSTHVEILFEIIRIISEFPAGKQILNRAVNRQRLNTLQQNVLPRRKQQLTELMSEDMPDEIQEDFVAREMKLIQSAVRAIGHRENFEDTARKNVQGIMNRFFAKFEPRKFQPKRVEITHTS